MGLLPRSWYSGYRCQCGGGVASPSRRDQSSTIGDTVPLRQGSRGREAWRVGANGIVVSGILIACCCISPMRRRGPRPRPGLWQDQGAYQGGVGSIDSCECVIVNRGRCEGLDAISRDTVRDTCTRTCIVLVDVVERAQLFTHVHNKLTGSSGAARRIAPYRLPCATQTVRTHAPSRQQQQHQHHTAA
jgi:hypothetical protein